MKNPDMDGYCFFPQQISNNHCLEEVFVIYDYTLTEAPM